MAPTIKTGLALYRLGMPFFRESKDIAQKFTNDHMEYLPLVVEKLKLIFINIWLHMNARFYPPMLRV